MNEIMKNGKKIKYCIGQCCGKEIIKTAYVLKDEGEEHIWVSSTKEDLRDGYGATIMRSDLR